MWNTRLLTSLAALLIAFPLAGQQYARPDGLTDNGGWWYTTTSSTYGLACDQTGNPSIWAQIDEVTQDNEDCCASDGSPDGTTDDGEVTLSSVTDPSSSTGHTLRCELGKSDTGGKQIDWDVELWQGPSATGTLIATLSVTDVSTIDATPDTYTLTGTEADNITNYGDLHLVLSPVGVGGGGPRRGTVSWCEFEVPSAGPPPDPGDVFVIGME